VTFFYFRSDADIRKHRVDIDMGWCYLFIVVVVKYSWSQTGSSIKYLLQKLWKLAAYAQSYTIRAPYVVVTASWKKFTYLSFNRPKSVYCQIRLLVRQRKLTSCSRGKPRLFTITSHTAGKCLCRDKTMTQTVGVVVGVAYMLMWTNHRSAGVVTWLLSTNQGVYCRTLPILLLTFLFLNVVG